MILQGEESISLSNLKESTTYVVRVQAMSSVGPGKVASIQITAPVLRDAHLGQSLLIFY
jgi:hypothetical protein